MKITAMIAWFDEEPEMLRDCILSLRGFADRLVCVDGPYAAFPHTTTRSPQDQWDAMMDSAREAGLVLELHGVDQAWDGPHGGECAKRTALFAYAAAGTDTGVDWLFSIDADEVVVQTRDVRYDLEETDLEVATVLLIDPAGTVALPQLFRAQPGIVVGPAHYQYTTADGRRLWCCHNETVEQLPAHRKLVLEHRPRRSDQRELHRWTYYLRRDTQRVEVPEIDEQQPHPEPGDYGSDAPAAGPRVAPELQHARH